MSLQGVLSDFPEPDQWTIPRFLNNNHIKCEEERQNVCLCVGEYRYIYIFIKLSYQYGMPHYSFWVNKQREEKHPTHRHTGIYHNISKSSKHTGTQKRCMICSAFHSTIQRFSIPLPQQKLRSLLHLLFHHCQSAARQVIPRMSPESER